MKWLAVIAASAVAGGLYFAFFMSAGPNPLLVAAGFGLVAALIDWAIFRRTGPRLQRAALAHLGVWLLAAACFIGTSLLLFLRFFAG